MIYVPNGFFVNMEFQNEFNYWDAYWIIKGIIWYRHLPTSRLHLKISLGTFLI